MTPEQIQKLIESALEKQREVMMQELAKTNQRHFPSIMSKALDNAGSKFRRDKLSEKNVDEMTVEERACMYARCMRYRFLAYEAGGGIELALDLAHRNEEKTLVNSWSASYATHIKALGESTLSGGGALLPPEFSSAIIELLSPASVVRASGPMVMPMNSGSLSISRIDSGASANYTGESVNATASEAAFGMLDLSDKKLVTLVPVSNDLLRNGGARVETIIVGDMVRAQSEKEDVTFIRSDGSAGEPIGLLNLASAATTNASAGTTDANIVTDIEQARFELTDGNVGLTGASWLMSHRSEKALRSIRDADGRFTWKPEMTEQGTIAGLPFRLTSQIPDNLGGGADESEVYLVGWPRIVLAENENMLSEMLPNVSYDNGSGVVSGASRDETVFRNISLHDFGARQQGAEIAVITGVQWT